MRASKVWGLGRWAVWWCWPGASCQCLGGGVGVVDGEVGVILGGLAPPRGSLWWRVGLPWWDFGGEAVWLE